MVLFIDACVRQSSRTLELSRRLLSHLSHGQIAERRLADFEFPKVDEAYLEKRDALIKAHKLNDTMFALANEFASADEIVIAAPYWDMSFPAALKQYFELINVIGITFRYTEAGQPKGLCKAKRLFYVSTSGGDYCPEEFGFGYVDALCKGFYGILETNLFMARGLDIVGRDVNAILEGAKREIDGYFDGQAVRR